MFKVGDEIKIINPECKMYGFYGTITSKINSYYTVSFGADVRYWYENEDLERINDMDISERLSEVIKENQELKQKLKQKLGEQNIKLDKIKADINRELRDKQGVSDEEFREAYEFWKDNNSNICTEIWGNGTLSEILFHTSLSEFVNKYKEYKDKQDNEIKVGDVVKLKIGGEESIVTRADSCIVYRLFRDGGCDIYTDKKVLEKTGKHYDSIDEFMNS